ncbi:MAG: Uma2 family endonuclease [Thermomicrobiales bacterium]
MQTTQLVRPLTMADLEGLPETNDRYQIITGELIVSPAPVPQHEEVSMRLILPMGAAVAKLGAGKVYSAPTTVRLTEHDVVEPDIMFVANHHRSMVGKVIEGAPDLVVEILSPSTRRTDLVRKMALYARAGVREYWIVDMKNRTVAVHALVDSRFELLANEGGFARSRVIEGFVIEVAPLFEDLW